MKTHPPLNIVEAHCSTCGATHAITTAAASIAVEVCANCHPAYTGRESTVARGSRIDRFNRRRELAA